METNPLERLYGVFLKPQTYLNMLYLFLAFPLGLAYFVFLVTGLSLRNRIINPVGRSLHFSGGAGTLLAAHLI